MKHILSLIIGVASSFLFAHSLLAQSDLEVLNIEAHDNQVHISLDIRNVQSAIDSLTVLISELNVETNSNLQVDDALNARIDSLAQLVLLLDNAQALGTTGQVLQVVTTEGTNHVGWVDGAYSAGTGIDLTSSEFSIGQAVGATDNVTFNEVDANGKTSLNDSLIVAGSATISGSLLIDSISVTDLINGQVGSIENHNIDALNDVPGMGSPGSYLRVKSDSSGLEYAPFEETTYTAGTGMLLTDSVFSIGQAVGTTDDVTFDDVTADSLTATITFLDTAMIGQLSVGGDPAGMGGFSIGTLEESSPFGDSYVANYISTTKNIQNFSNTLTAVHSETMSLEFANQMSETGIQGQVGSVKGVNFTGNGLRESYIGISRDSLLQEYSGGPIGGDVPPTLYESEIALALAAQTSTEGGIPNPEADLTVLSEFFSMLPIEAGLLQDVSIDGDSDELNARESTVAKKSSAFSAYQSSGLRNVRQVYQANTDSSSQAYVVIPDSLGGGDMFDIDSIDFSTTEAQTILQTYNDEYVDFEYLEMTAQDSGLTVTHDDYGIALSTGTRYQQATDSTVTRIPATTGLEMHAGSGKAVLYADTIEFRGVVQMYEDVEIIGDLTVPNLVEQNMGVFVIDEQSEPEQMVPVSSSAPGDMAYVPLQVNDILSIQPESENYSYDIAFDGGVQVDGDDAKGIYLVSATMTVQNLSEFDHDSFWQNNSTFLPPSGEISSHEMRLSLDPFAYNKIDGCRTSFYYLGDSTETTVNLTCYVHHENSGNLKFYVQHENSSDSDMMNIKGVSVGMRKMNHFVETDD